MALQDELERTGSWLFRWRSYLPIVIIGVFLLTMRKYEYPLQNEAVDHIWEVFCLFVCFIGLSIRIFTIGYIPKGTSGRNTKTQAADTLNTTGIYSLVRNPLYLGNFFIYLGIAIFVHLWWPTLVFVLAFWLYYERIILAEEAFLKNKFGQFFLEWAETTPVFIPRFSGFRKPALPFSVKNVLRREYNGYFSIIVVLFLFETIGEFFAEGRFDFDLWWVLAFGFSLLVWITLRTLKKYTTILDVKDR